MEPSTMLLGNFLLYITPLQLLTNYNVAVALLAAVFIAALAYMTGEFFSAPTLKGFAKAELYELGVSAVILVIALTLIVPNGPFDMVARGFMLQGAPPDQVCSEWKANAGTLVGAGSNAYYTNANIAFGQAGYFLGCNPKLREFSQVFKDITSNAYPGYTLASIWNDMFEGVMLKKLATGYGSLMMIEMFTGLLSGFYTGLTIPLRAVNLELGLNPWVAMTPLNQFHTTLVDTVGNTMAAFVAQKMLLDFFEETMLPVFLPFGLLLRAFPFSRKTGSTIIAVVFAAYFIYPISILVNQQIYEMIASPQGSPGCTAIGNSCSKDTDCCSYDCRPNPLLPGKQCVSPITDFSEYASVVTLCQEKGWNVLSVYESEEFKQTLKKAAGEQDKAVLGTYFTGSASTSKWTKTEARLEEGLDEVRRQSVVYGNFFTFAQQLPTPGHAVQYMFNAMETLVLDTSQFVILAMLFIVIEIVLTLTLFKDFAIMIGGEPRIFGLSKLV